MTDTQSRSRTNGSQRSAESADSLLSRHLPPSDIGLENMALGSAMFQLSAIDKIAFLREDMLFGEVQQHVLCELRKWRADGREFDGGLFPRHMQKIHPLAVGQWEKLCLEMVESVYHSQHIVDYAEQVRDLWVKRQAIYSATELLRNAYESVDFPTALSSHQAALNRLQESHEGSDGVSITTACLDQMAAWERPREVGDSSGFQELDNMLGGLLPMSVYVIAGRPGDGKTGLALAFADCISRDLATLIFSLEMSRGELVGRLVSRLIEVPSKVIAKKIRDGHPPKNLAEGLSQLSQRRLTIDDRDHLTVDQIAATARIHAGRGKLGLIVIDYLQLITPRDRKVNREQQIAESSRSIKQLAKQTRCPILLLSQMNRAVEGRADKEPQLSDLRESGAIEQDADAVIFIWAEPKGDQSQRKLLIRKNRHGPLGHVTVEWLPQYTTFKPIQREWHDADNHDPMA